MPGLVDPAIVPAMPDSDDPALVTARAYEAGAVAWAEGAAVDRAAWGPQYDGFAALVSPGGLALDLGCGAGLDAPGLTRRGLTLIGVDVSLAMCRLARSQPALAGRLAVADQRDLPFARASFDAVWADGVLHHVSRGDAPRTLSEAARVLRRGGIYCASVERGTGGEFVEGAELPGRRWYTYYDADEIAEMARSADLDVIDVVVAGVTPRSNGFVMLLARAT